MVKVSEEKTTLYLNAAAWGTSRRTPLAGAGYGAAPWKEAVVQGLQVSLALAMLAGSVLVVYALR
jgi:hypothetical protein